MKLARRMIIVTSWLSVLAVLGYWAGLRLIGERWWLTTLVLYVPHLVLLVPVAVIAAATALLGPRRLLVVHVLVAGVVVFPIMGLELSGPAPGRDGAPRLRVLSFNAGSGRRSAHAMAEEILAARPDVVLLQESGPEVNAVIAARLPGFEVRTSTQFFIASRGPILELYEPPKLAFGGIARSPRFVRVTLDTAVGKVDVYNVHPISPRDAIDGVRADGPDARGANGERGVVGNNTSLRRLQVQTFAALAASSTNPVIIAGDTNLPGPSRMFVELLGRWQDGFEAVGRGFGYTFPVGRHGAWMRIDRILAGPELRFLEFQVGRGLGSDHYCVWAELERVAR